MNNAIELTERYLHLDKWKFKESARYLGNMSYPTVIYDSEICRFRVYFDVHARRGHHNLVLHYGRLEVPDKAEVLLGEDQENYHIYWHSVRFPLWFLDGLSPQEAVAEKDPRFIREFEQSEMAKKIEYEPEKTLVKHAAIWGRATLKRGHGFYPLILRQAQDRSSPICANFCAFLRLIPLISED